MRLAVLLVAAALLSIKGCNWAGDALLAPGRPAPDRVGLVDGTDITFFVAADTHFGYGDIAEKNVRQINTMNSLPGTPLPERYGGGTIAEPRGVLIAGDLTEGGKGPQWSEFVRHYGLSGGDGLLKWPVYEGTGNHDRTPWFAEPVLKGVRQRHGDLLYSWNWDDVHFVNLDLYPNAANVRWLKRDLVAVGCQRPIVIYFHYPLAGPFSDWWSDEERDAFAQAIEGYNVIAIFHGHYHHSMHYVWRGLDIYNVGSPRHGMRSFAAVHVTDTHLTVASWNWEAGAWQWIHRKTISAPAPAATR